MLRPHFSCQVRALFDDKGKRVDEAGPSIPVQVFIVVKSTCFLCHSYSLLDAITTT